MKNSIEAIRDWAFKTHADHNQEYEAGVPYSYHLNMVMMQAEAFFIKLDAAGLGKLLKPSDRKIILAACACHDLIEDTRTSYKKVLEMTCEEVAEIVRAVTNNSRGRNREEKMPDYIYEEIRSTPFAVIVKLCDRLANVTQGVLTSNPKRMMYKKEHHHFSNMLYNASRSDEEILWEMLDTLLDKC